MSIADGRFSLSTCPYVPTAPSSCCKFNISQNNRKCPAIATLIFSEGFSDDKRLGYFSQLPDSTCLSKEGTQAFSCAFSTTPVEEFVIHKHCVGDIAKIWIF